MTFTVIFIVSGLIIITLLGVKGLEIKRRKQFFITRAISNGDIHARALYHKAVSVYSEGKDRIKFFIIKRVPMRSKNLLNKTLSFLEDKRRQYADNMRDSKLLKKQDGISEFFKNISDVEKGNGEIHDVYEDISQNAKDKVK